MTVIAFLNRTLQVPRPVDCLRQDSELRKCREKKSTYSVPVIGQMNLRELLQYADHIVFNSPSQLLRFGLIAKKAGKSVGLRINPECSTQEGHEIYDPCAPGSRMGTTRKQLDEASEKNPELLNLLDGIHFHTLCEQDSDDLETTLVSVKKHFGDLAARVKWINFGGGHHITKPGYHMERLEQCIQMAKAGVECGRLS